MLFLPTSSNHGVVSRLPGFEDFPYSEITVKELLTHTSGIWYWKEPSPGVRTGIAPHLTNKLEKEPETTVRDKSLEFVARHYANPTLYPLESTTPQYSNIGYLMLGWIVERLSHRPFEQFVKETILEPLKMKDTFFFPSTASPAQQARLAELDRCLPDPLDYAHYDKTDRGGCTLRQRADSIPRRKTSAGSSTFFVTADKFPVNRESLARLRSLF